MDIKLKNNKLNNIPGGSVLFHQNDPITHICAILRGSVQMTRRGVDITLGPGSMVGVADAYTDHYLCTYTVKEDSVIYVFPIRDEAGMAVFLSTYMDYRGISIASQNRMATEINRVREKLMTYTNALYNNILDTYHYYEKKSGPMLVRDEVIEHFEPFDPRIPLTDPSIICCAERAQIPMDLQKSYYETCENLSIRENEELTAIISALLEDCTDILEYAGELFNRAINQKETSLAENMTNYGIYSKANQLFEAKYAQYLQNFMEFLKKSDIDYARLTGIHLLSETNKTSDLVTALLTAPTLTEEEIAENKADETISEMVATNHLASLKGSLDQILSFAGLAEEKTAVFKDGVEQIVSMSDRMEITDDMRKLRRSLSAIFYDLYESCYRKSKTEVTPYCVTLLLNYGFVDERLLDQDQLEFLCDNRSDDYISVCHIYRMPEWLDLVHSGQKQPSKNEFNQDWAEYLRTMRKEGRLTDEQVAAMTDDLDEKLHFEITNMFPINMRSVNGQISTFLPFLYKDILYGSIEKLFVSKQSIADAIDKFRAIDFTIFHHEVLFQKPEIGLDRTYINEEVYPDIIMMPVYGQNSSMWQEIDGRKRNTSARGMFPSFADGGVEAMTLKFLGRYRWEYCRCVQGVHWNDIKTKCLTSEYSDYIQYYRKNRDLSEARREKVKLQIQKGKNNLREIFLQDYEMWMQSESNGAMKLNKVSREIVATYCPFDSATRKKLKQNPAISDAFKRLDRENAKTAHTLELKIRSIEAQGNEVPPELKRELTLHREAVNLN